MSQKNLITRVKNKTDTRANWEKATNFIPLKGEICYYSDINKFKVGDGITAINDLEYFNDGFARSFSGLVATSNDNNGATFYFGEIVPEDLNKEWSAEFQICAHIPGQTNYWSFHNVRFGGFGSTVSSYYSYNAIRSTSYKPIYYTSLRYVTSTGFSNGKGHLLGVNLYNSSNPTSSSYPRTIEVRMLDNRNCSFSFHDYAQRITQITNYSTYYGSQYNADAFNNGLRHSGDDNDMSNIYDYSAYQTLEGWSAYSIVGMAANGKRTRIINADGTCGTTPFVIGKPIWWTDSTRNNNTAYGTWNGNFYSIRISANCPNACAKKWGLTTLTVNDSIYIKCSRATATTFLPVGLTTTLPTQADDYFYIYYGKPYQAYTNTTGTIAISITQAHPIYYWDNIDNCLMELRGERGATGAAGTAATISIGTVTTGAAGTQAAVTNSGTSSRATLNFTIPQGAKGAQGYSIAKVNPISSDSSTYGVYLDDTSGSKVGEFTVPTVTGHQDTTSTADGGSNTFLFTINGTGQTFTVKNGNKGSTGTRGSRWNSGTAMTGTSSNMIQSSSGITDALVGDMYLNTSTGNIYQCTAAGAASVARWSYITQMQLPKNYLETDLLGTFTCSSDGYAGNWSVSGYGIGPAAPTGAQSMLITLEAETSYDPIAGVGVLSTTDDTINLIARQLNGPILSVSITTDNKVVDIIPIKAQYQHTITVTVPGATKFTFSCITDSYSNMTTHAQLVTHLKNKTLMASGVVQNNGIVSSIKFGSSTTYTEIGVMTSTTSFPSNATITDVVTPIQLF